MKKFKSSALGRLLTVFVLIMIPILIISFLFLREYINRLEKEPLDNILHNVNNVAESFQDEVVLMERALTSIIQLESVNQLAHTVDIMEPIEVFDNVNSTRDIMDNTKSYLNTIECIRLFLPALDVIYNTTGHSGGSQSDFDQELYDRIYNGHLNSNIINIIDDNLVLSRINSYQAPTVIAMLKMNEQALHQKFSAPLIYDNSYFILNLINDDYSLTNLPDDIKEQVIDSVSGAENGYSEININGLNTEEYYLFSYRLTDMGAQYQILIEKTQLSSSNLYYYFIIVLLVSIVIIIVFFWSAFHIMHKPLNVLVEAFKTQGEKLDLNQKIQYTLTSDFNYLYLEYNQMIDKLNKYILSEFQKDLLIKKVQLKQLQAQINPHFLYNTYFMLYRMIKAEQYDKSILVAQQLGKYFEYITRNAQDIVPLKNELEHAMIYCSIQQLRFSNRIAISCDALDEFYSDIPIPNIILQPIIENAFVYGLENKVEDGLLRINFEYQPTKVIINIEDNGEELTDSGLKMMQDSIQNLTDHTFESEATAIVNIAKRLLFVSDGKSYLTLMRSELGGLKVSFTIHFSNDDQMPENEKGDVL